MEKDKLIKIKNTIKDQAQEITTITGLSSLLVYTSNLDNIKGGVVVQSIIGTIFVGSYIYVAYKGTTDIIPNLIDEEIEKQEMVLKRVK